MTNLKKYLVKETILCHGLDPGQGAELKNFPRDFFSYIIVDEFHHAAADSYLNVLGYFRPQFLLGLTATPYRM